MKTEKFLLMKKLTKTGWQWLKGGTVIARKISYESHHPFPLLFDPIEKYFICFLFAILFHVPDISTIYSDFEITSFGRWFEYSMFRILLNPPSSWSWLSWNINLLLSKINGNFLAENIYFFLTNLKLKKAKIHSNDFRRIITLRSSIFI